MVTDFEAAWHDLMAYVAGKTQHGRDALLREMVRIADSRRVAAGELSRLLRLYGVEVERVRSISEQGPADPEHSESDSLALGTIGSRGIIDHDLGGHDVGGNGRGNGRVE